MPHIALRDLPGIRALFAFRPETAEPINRLVDFLLAAPNSLSRGDRELIATYTSFANKCYYCGTSHGMSAARLLGNDEALVESVKCDFETAEISDKLKALINIAGRVQQSGLDVTPEDVDRARRHGATDFEIHDAVLIAATFCMLNRYVDGLGTIAPPDLDSYRQRAQTVADHGYMGVHKAVQDAVAAQDEAK